MTSFETLVLYSTKIINVTNYWVAWVKGVCHDSPKIGIRMTISGLASGIASLTYIFDGLLIKLFD